jgi:DNA-binding NarL/FixJ family response regulator
MSPEAGWLLVNQIVPRIAATVPRSSTPVGSEDAQELVQDAVALAARMLHLAEAKKKKVTAGNIAYYTIQHSKSGRRSVGNSVADVYGTGTQLSGRVRLASFDEPVHTDENSGESLTLGDVFGLEAEDPSVTAARNLDWETFLAAQNKRGKAILQALLEGRSFTEVAKEFRVSLSAIQGHKNQLGSKLLEFMGSDILQDLAHKPQWQMNLETARERMACREARR